jgi:hypothetical protein
MHNFKIKPLKFEEKGGGNYKCTRLPFIFYVRFDKKKCLWYTEVDRLIVPANPITGSSISSTYKDFDEAIVELEKVYMKLITAMLEEHVELPDRIF